MSRILTVTVMVLMMTFSLDLAAQQSKKVLFIGNSYTAVNDLPAMVASVALSMGDTLIYSENTPGGCTFSQHCTNQSMSLIKQGGWDAVVLQEQSQYPSFPQSQVEDEVFPYATRLVDSIYAHGWCSEPMFYMTWGRKDGDSYNAQFFPPLATYEGMDSLLCLRYMQMAEMNDASVCPVGRVWHHLRNEHPEIELYQSDGSHPSAAGTYAAACSFYTMLFLRDPDSITFKPQISSETASIIRQTVQSVVFDSLSTWRRSNPEIYLAFADTTQYMSCSFGVACTDCDSILCDWGDGVSDYMAYIEDVTLNHQYADTGLYTIELTALRHCLSAETTNTFHAVPEPSDPPASVENAEASMITVSPNPASTEVRLTVPSEAIEVEVCDLQGRRLATSVPQNTACTMSVASFPTGTYLLRIRMPQSTVTRRLIVIH